MNFVTKVACRTVGTAGMGLALYDAYSVGKHFAKSGAETETSNYMEKIYRNSRTTDSVSYTSNVIRKETFDLMSRNPLPTLWGKTKGGCYGFLYGLSTNIVTVASSAIALTAKGGLAKLGTVGAITSVLYKIARDGLGLGKETPMD